ncbi:MAG: sulfur carrier protein ThiS [Thermoplasmatota archaeon]
MTLRVNGRKVEFREGESVKRLLRRMNFNFPLVIVKIDGSIIEEKKYISTKLHDDAEVEVIHLTSGG